MRGTRWPHRHFGGSEIPLCETSALGVAELHKPAPRHGDKHKPFAAAPAIAIGMKTRNGIVLAGRNKVGHAYEHLHL